MSRVRRAERERERGWGSGMGVGYPTGPHPRRAQSVPHKLWLWTLSHTQCSVAVIWPPLKSATLVKKFYHWSAWYRPENLLNWDSLVGTAPRLLPHNQHTEVDFCPTTSQHPLTTKKVGLLWIVIVVWNVNSTGWGGVGFWFLDKKWHIQLSIELWGYLITLLYYRLNVFQ